MNFCPDTKHSIGNFMGVYEDLLKQIDRFIRKYYKNELARGLLFFIGIFLISFLVTTTLEYFGRFNSYVRGFLFFTFLGLNLFIFLKFFVRPTLKLFSFGKQIDRYQAATIIGSFFPDISDRLLNTLQLNDSLDDQTANLELIRASVSQRSSSLSVISFPSAIDIKKNNKKYAIYILPFVALFFTILFLLPQFFKQSTERVIHFEQEFKPIAPFNFILTKNEFTIKEGEDLKLDLLLKGALLPEKVYLVCNQGTFLMNKTAKNSFSYPIQNNRTSSTFYFTANEFESINYSIKVIGKTVVKKLDAFLHFPDYLGLKDELIKHVGNIVVPEGTIVNWDILTDNASKSSISIYKKKKSFSDSGIKFQSQFMSNSDVSIVTTNKFDGSKDTILFTVEVIPDAFPSINVEQQSDSLSSGLKFFSGFASDDYGLSKLSFVYVIKNKNVSKTNKLPVQAVKGTNASFLFSFDFLRAGIVLSDDVEYYFEVSDNDGLRGGKVSRSMLFHYEVPSLDELNEQRDENLDDAQNELSAIIKQSNSFMKEVDRLKKDVLNSKGNDFNKIQQVKQLKEEQKQLKNLLESIQESLEQSNDEQNQLSEQDKKLLEKQDLIDDLLKEVMDDELLDLLNKLEQLMKEGKSKEEIKQQVDDIKRNSEDQNKQLDRTLEMLKKLQVNEKIDAIEKELKSLSSDQDALKKQSEKEELSSDQLLKKQEEINNRFDEIKDDLNALDKLNKELSKPLDMNETQSKETEIDQDLNTAQDKLSKNKSSKASESQKSASDKMKQLADQLNKDQEESNKQQQEEDIATLRMILKNLVNASFSQERTFIDFSKVKDDSPSYGVYAKNQQKIIDNTQIIKDSLLALSKRQPKAASFIDKELNDIFKNFDLAKEDIDEHRKRPLLIHQQEIMTSFNNLSLLLNESLENMQSEMNSKPGSGSCDNPGGKGKPKSGAGGVGDLKQQLRKQLESMEKGSNPGGKNPGEGEGGFSSKDFSKMAAQQSLIRKSLENMKNELNKDGKGSGNMLDPLIKELEAQEKALVNKQLNPGVLNRQKEILSRLLESEKALLERGWDDKRESSSGKNKENGNQIKFDEYKKQKLKQIEMLHTVEPIYRKYYKDKVNEYFNLGF